MLSITFCKTANKAERCSIEVSSAPQNNSCLAPERSGAFLFAARGELAHPSGANENAGARSARHELFCRPPNRDRRSRPAGAKAIPSPPPTTNSSASAPKGGGIFVSGSLASLLADADGRKNDARSAALMIVVEASPLGSPSTPAGGGGNPLTSCRRIRHFNTSIR